MWMIGGSIKMIVEWDLSTPWDITTATIRTKKYIAHEENRQVDYIILHQQIKHSFLVQVRMQYWNIEQIKLLQKLLLIILY
jgi:hypothetical protein